MTSAHIGHYLSTRVATLPIAKFTSHDLRRTFATMLAEMGIALDLVAAIVGHESGGKDTRTLVRHYVRTDMLERKAHALRAWDERLRAIVTGAGSREGGEAATRWMTSHKQPVHQHAHPGFLSAAGDRLRVDAVRDIATAGFLSSGCRHLKGRGENCPGANQHSPAVSHATTAQSVSVVAGS